jgi:hypothetical protein
MSEADGYRANLATCWRMAEKSDELGKRAWLEMAESWRLLIISDCGSPIGDDLAVVSQGVERGWGPWFWDAYRRSANARLERLPGWIVWVVSSGAHLAGSARGLGILRWPTLATSTQERSAHNLRNMYRWLMLSTRQYILEDRSLRERAASLINVVFPSKDEPALTWRAAERRTLRSLSANMNADSARQRPSRRRA